MRRRSWPGDDLAVLPAKEREWRGYAGRSMRFSHESIVIDQALRVLAKHAFEARDERMAGRVLAAAALTGTNVVHVWEDCTPLLPVPVLTDPSGDPARDGNTRRLILDTTAREFFVRGVRGRPRALLRAEARGLLYALRWLYRVGLLPRRALSHAELGPWRRATGAPAEAHPNILGPLPPSAASLN